MSVITVFAPVFVQVGLTFALLFWLGVLRVRLVKSGAVQLRDISLDGAGWPREAVQAANAFSNQFELPLLFYLVVVLAFFSANATPGLVVLAWLFVVTRLLHALVHVTTNNVPRRFAAYAAGLAILVVMWLLFLAHLIFGV